MRKQRGGQHTTLRARGLATATALILAGCSSLPTITPDMAYRAPADPQVVGARGPLAPERSRQVLERLRQGRPEATLLDRHLALEEALVGSPLVAGNRVRLLIDGPATYEAMQSAIRAATTRIHMETYIFEADEVGRHFAALLIEKARAGVAVRLIHDSVGTLAVPRDFFDTLRAGGVEVVEYNPVNPLAARAGWDVNGRDHRKQLIVDGRVVLLGGINISSVYSGSSSPGAVERSSGAPLPWRDTDVQIEGPIVAEFEKLFIETWLKQKGPPIGELARAPQPPRGGSDVVRAIGSSPDEPYSAIYATLISAIRSAEQDVLLTNAYFVPDPQLIDALKGAAARGVRVALILPSESDSALVFHAGRSYYAELLAAGIEIHERRGALLHAKTALIDGVWSTIGSTNLDWRSFLHNQELNAVVLGAEFGAQMRAMFERDLAASERITLTQWRRRPLGARLKERFGRLWAYWL